MTPQEKASQEPIKQEQQSQEHQAQTAQHATQQEQCAHPVEISTVKVERANIAEGEVVRFTLTSNSAITKGDLDAIKKNINIQDLTSKFPVNVGDNVVNLNLSRSNDNNEVTGELDTTGFAEGGYLVQYANTEPVPSNRRENLAPSARFSVRSSSVGSTDVNLQRTSSHPTRDQAFWVAIRNSTNGISFDRYQRFISLVFGCKDGPESTAMQLNSWLENTLPEMLPGNNIQLNIHGPYSYSVLKLATQAFLTLQSGVKENGNDPSLLRKEDINGKKLFDRHEEERRLGRHVSFDKLKHDLSRYLGHNDVLPYLDRIVSALLAVSPNKNVEEQLHSYHSILQYRATQPSLIELIWSYWHEEGMLAQTMNAIALRFQNQRSGPNDPLAELEIDPLRPLNNMIWGFVQDRYNQLSVSRRAAEYDHQYGIRLVGRAVPELQSADSRSKFIEAFHNLLYRTAVFYREDADTTVIADAFPLLNALKDVHLLLAEGAHNQYGDLPWTARAEMLSQQWMLARPEMREFLRGRHMVPYQEPWMGAVDAMKKLQGWSDTTISHFNELAVDGERVLLSIRFGDWSDLNQTDDNARNWARYWKPEIQRYLYGYLAVTGVDLMADVVDTREAEVRYIQPSALLQRRLAGQTRQPAALAAAPRRQAIAAPAGPGYAALPRPQTSRVSRVRAIRYEQGE